MLCEVVHLISQRLVCERQVRVHFVLQAKSNVFRCGMYALASVYVRVYSTWCIVRAKCA
jgi:hypothetical protein